MTISWDEAALTAFGDAMEFIAGNSYSAAIQVAAGIDNALRAALSHPLANPADKYREDGDTSFRVFESYNFRINNRVEPEGLVVVRFRHTKQKPQSY